jgi:hypothetical protein
MPLVSAFRGIVSIPAAALATQLLPVCHCNRLSWSVIIAVICAAALLVVVDRLAVVLLLLLMVLLMLLAGLLAGGLLETGSMGIAGLSACGWLVPTQVDGWKGAARVDLD